MPSGRRAPAPEAECFDRSAPSGPTPGEPGTALVPPRAPDSGRADIQGFASIPIGAATESLNAGIADGTPGLGWLHAKIALVVLLSGYHGWAVGYARKLAAGRATLSNRALRLVNEVPAIAAVLIVILVIVKPF